MLKALLLAFVLFLDGQTIALQFDTVAACEEFAKAIAPYVESVECEIIMDPIGVGPH